MRKLKNTKLLKKQRKINKEHNNKVTRTKRRSFVSLALLSWFFLIFFWRSWNGEKHWTLWITKETSVPNTSYCLYFQGTIVWTKDQTKMSLGMVKFLCLESNWIISCLVLGQCDQSEAESLGIHRHTISNNSDKRRASWLTSFQRKQWKTNLMKYLSNISFIFLFFSKEHLWCSIFTKLLVLLSKHSECQ